VRQHLNALAVVLLVGVAGTAHADPSRTDPLHPKAIDIKPMVDKLVVYRDETGMFFVGPEGTNLDQDVAEKWVFFGDAKTMYQQRVVGFSTHDGRYEWYLWSPRVRGIQTAMVTIDNHDRMTIECRAKQPGKELTRLPADAAKAVLMKATFMPPLWVRQAHSLARDDEGTYYYVDELREEYGGNGFRVFIGQKGAMKQQPMTNVVSDSAGEIFATKSGELKIVSSEDGKPYWKKGSKRVDLVKLVPQDNKYVIYRELGIYGSLGVVCDDQ